MHRSMLVSRFARRGAFTLVELMIVVVIVAILAMIAIPLYRGSLDDARMAEGIAGVGTIHTACRVKMASGGLEEGMSLEDLGFQDGDLDGKYFDDDAYDLDVTDATSGSEAYTITATLPDSDPEMTYIIDQDGEESGTFTTE